MISKCPSYGGGAVVIIILVGVHVLCQEDWGCGGKEIVNICGAACGWGGR